MYFYALKWVTEIFLICKVKKKCGIIFVLFYFENKIRTKKEK